MWSGVLEKRKLTHALAAILLIPVVVLFDVRLCYQGLATTSLQLRLHALEAKEPEAARRHLVNADCW